MIDKLNVNRVTKRRNRTLKEIIRTMISYSTSPVSMWGETLKTIVHILNKISTKSVKKIPYELWTNKKLYLGYMYIWRCPAKAKIYNPHEKSLNSMTISGYFIGYIERSRGYRFYCPTHITRIVEIDRVVFLEDGCVSWSILRDYVFEESQEDVVLNQVFEDNNVYPI